MLIVWVGQGGHCGARATCSAWGAGKMLIVGSGQGVRRVPVHRVPQRDDPRATLRLSVNTRQVPPPPLPQTQHVQCGSINYPCCAPPKKKILPPPLSIAHIPPDHRDYSWGVGKVVFADISQASSLRRRRLLHRSREQDAQHDGGTVVEGGKRVPGHQRHRDAGQGR